MSEHENSDFLMARGGREVPSGGSLPHTNVGNGPTARTSPARILVVEDQEDVRRMLTTALSMEGHVVDEAPSAAAGLHSLQQTSYDLVLTDYAMPGGTGTWMLHEAGRQGLLVGTAAMIVTAHPDVREIANVEVITKPLDLDHFLEQVRRILSAGPPSPAPHPVPPPVPPQTARRPEHRVELVLYVSSASPASMQARRNMERLLDGFDRSQVHFSVCDLGQNPAAGDADRIAFTPTLVKRYPEPRMWVLGNLKEPEIIGDLLRVCGVDAAG